MLGIPLLHGFSTAILNNRVTLNASEIKGHEIRQSPTIGGSEWGELIPPLSVAMSEEINPSSIHASQY